MTEYNKKRNYAIIDENGKVLEYCRLNATAITRKEKLEKQLKMRNMLKIIKI